MVNDPDSEACECIKHSVETQHHQKHLQISGSVSLLNCWPLVHRRDHKEWGEVRQREIAARNLVSHKFEIRSYQQVDRLLISKPVAANPMTYPPHVYAAKPKGINAKLNQGWQGKCQTEPSAPWMQLRNEVRMLNHCWQLKLAPQLFFSVGDMGIDKSCVTVLAGHQPQVPLMHLLMQRLICWRNESTHNRMSFHCSAKKNKSLFSISPKCTRWEILVKHVGIDCTSHVRLQESTATGTYSSEWVHER